MTRLWVVAKWEFMCTVNRVVHRHHRFAAPVSSRDWPAAHVLVDRHAEDRVAGERSGGRGCARRAGGRPAGRAVVADEAEAPAASRMDGPLRCSSRRTTISRRGVSGRREGDVRPVSPHRAGGEPRAGARSSVRGCCRRNCPRRLRRARDRSGDLHSSHRRGQPGTNASRQRLAAGHRQRSLRRLPAAEHFDLHVFGPAAAGDGRRAAESRARGPARLGPAAAAAGGQGAGALSGRVAPGRRLRRLHRDGGAGCARYVRSADVHALVVDGVLPGRFCPVCVPDGGDRRARAEHAGEHADRERVDPVRRPADLLRRLD